MNTISSRLAWIPIAAWAAASFVVGAVAAQAPAPQVPLVEGLTIVTAVNNGKADFESIKRVSEVTADFVRVTVTSDMPTEDGSIAPLIRSRIVRRSDLESARSYAWNFSPPRPDVYPGSTALGVSATVLRELRTAGSAQLAVNDGVSASPSSGVLRRTEERPVAVDVIVNDEPARLPAIHARGQLGPAAAEFWILDDDANPLALRWSLGPIRLQAVKLSFPGAAGSSVARFERELEGAGRIVLYGIYFDSASDRVKPESAATLTEIASMLRRNAGWTITVEGHTDALGGEAYNLDLSRRRAVAVRQALVADYGIDGKRLQTAGFGASRPKDSNDTLEGRARNRRVELVRVQ
jgi:outer membrane protein OmpA-like peptidoglycan-associated protein